MNDPLFVRRPISGCSVAFVTVPGLLTGVALLIGGAQVRGPLAFRAALFAMGAVFVALSLVLAFSHSGVLLDRAAGTVTPCWSFFGLRRRGAPIPVEPEDRVVVRAVMAAPSANPNIQNTSVALEGPSGSRFLLGTREREAAQRAAAVIAEHMGIAAELDPPA